MNRDESNLILTRRGALMGAASVAGLAALGPLLPRALAGLHLVITDPRFKESAQFRASAGDSVPHIAIEPDLGGQWYGGLRQAVRGKTITGLTSWIDFVVLAGCMREEGLRVVSSRSATTDGRIHQVSWLMSPRPL